MKKQLEIDLNRFPQNSPIRNTFEQIVTYLLSLRATNQVKYDLKTAIFEGKEDSTAVSLQPSSILKVPGKIYSVSGMCQTAPTVSFPFSRWVPMSVDHSGTSQYGVYFDYANSDNEIRLYNYTTRTLEYRIVVLYK